MICYFYYAAMVTICVCPLVPMAMWLLRGRHDGRRGVIFICTATATTLMFSALAFWLLDPLAAMCVDMAWHGCNGNCLHEVFE
jgi:hypothetical protein